MSDALDLLLDQVREPEPADDAFVQIVMSDVRTFEQKRWSRRMLRRPMVTSIVAAVLVTGGAVAAVVGTNPKPAAPQTSTHAPTAQVTAKAAQLGAATDRAASPAASMHVPNTAPISGKGWGYSSNHTSFVLDAKSGLRLETETYKTDFTVGKPQRVTLTLENTSKSPIAFSSTDGCALQVMAFPADSSSGTSDPRNAGGRFAWVCAGSNADPRTAGVDEKFVLAPGDRHSADAFVNLPDSGAWNVIGVCRCSYTKLEQPSPAPAKGDPLKMLQEHALPPPLVPERTDGKNLATPPISVRAN